MSKKNQTRSQPEASPETALGAMGAQDKGILPHEHIIHFRDPYPTQSKLHMSEWESSRLLLLRQATEQASS